MYMFFHLIFFFNCICQWSLMVSALLNLLLVDPISSSICHSWLPFWNTFFCWFSGHHILLPLVGWFAASLAITTSHPAQYMLVCSCTQPFPLFLSTLPLPWQSTCQRLLNLTLSALLTPHKFILTAYPTNTSASTCPKPNCSYIFAAPHNLSHLIAMLSVT